MNLGDPRVFYYPQGTIYATPFDTHWLAALAARGAGPQEVLAAIKSRNVPYIVVNWPEIWRLASTTGYPSALSDELYDRWVQGRPAGLAILDRLVPLGLRVEDELFLPTTTSQAATTQTATSQAATSRATASQIDRGWQPYDYPRTWPRLTIYALPWAPQAQTRPAETAPAANR